MTAKNKTTKFISALLIILIIMPSILLSMPKKVSAIWGVADISFDAPVLAQGTVTAGATTSSAASQFSLLGLKLKDVAIWMGQQLLMQVAKKFLAEMTQATINWINSDFHGSPLFIENPGSFFKDIGKYAVRTLVDMIGYDTFRFPFGKQTALNVINSYKSQLATNAQYTLSKVINDPDLLIKYRNDFNYGGWNGFLVNTQYPQNNYLGFNMMIQQNLASQLEGTLVAPAQKIKDALQQGMGFLSPQTCPSNPNYNNGTNEFLKPSFKSKIEYKTPTLTDNTENDYAAYKAYQENYQSSLRAEKESWNDPQGPNVCPGGLVSTTPGSVAGNQIMMAMGSSFRQSELGAALGNSLSAVFDALINHFLDKGLNALKSTVSPASGKDNNWSYDGNTLGGNTTTTGATGPLNIPQNVSVSVGETTSTIISGGATPYRIQTEPNKAVATVQISTSSASGYPTLTVTGVAPGQTSVVIKDSSIPSKTTTVIITVNAIGALAVIPHDISTRLNHPTVAKISGGEGPYFIRIDPNGAIAVAVLSETNLIITGIAKGNTLVVIEDSSSPIKKTAIIPITINGPDDLVITPPNASVKIGEVTSITISGGTTPYIVTNQQNIGVATIQISPATPTILTVTGIAVGQTSAIITDSSNPFKVSNISITVLAPMGSCAKSFGKDFNLNQQMNEAQCKAIEGRWTPNSTP